MNVVVTGATGLVGRPLVRALLARGDSVTVLTRDPERAAERLPAGCALAPWRDGTGVEPAVLRDAGAVVHLAGAGIAEQDVRQRHQQYQGSHRDDGFGQADRVR